MQKMQKCKKCKKCKIPSSFFIEFFSHGMSIEKSIYKK
jgi:hypothetical protein